MQLQAYDACVDLAEMGLRVFPCHWPQGARCSCGKALCANRGKHPLRADWQREATTDPARIAELWDEWPDANVGIATGNGIVVIDIDPRHGGAEAWEALERTFGPLPETLTAETGSGGWHYYFKTTAKVRNSAGKLGPGLDVRGDGGLVIAPPSLHASGERYRWYRLAPIAELPGWLLRKLERPDPKPAEAAGDVFYVSGERHDRMVQFAGHLRGKAGLSPEAIEAALLVENLRRCRPPLPEGEVRSLARSTKQWAQGADVTDAPKPTWPTIGERLRSVQSLGPRIPTGISELDRLSRGGVRPGQVLVLGGAPGAGKTTLAVQIASHLARGGVTVGWLAIDEESSGIDARMLQAIGVSRDRVEEPDEETVRIAEEQLGGLPFYISEEASVEEMFARIVEVAPTGGKAVFIDSVQTARTERTSGIDNVRERINDVIKTAKELAVRHKVVLVMTSELSRGSYRSRKRDDQIEDLAAFKESGSIEYAGQILVVLRSGDEDTLVHANVPKCRAGRKGSFDMVLDFDRATFAIHTADPMAEWNKHVGQILEAVREMPGLGTNDLATLVGRRKDDVIGALDELAAAGRIVDKGKRNAHKWHICATDEWGIEGGL